MCLNRKTRHSHKKDTKNEREGRLIKEQKKLTIYKTNQQNKNVKRGSTKIREILQKLLLS